RTHTHTHTHTQTHTKTHTAVFFSRSAGLSSPVTKHSHPCTHTHLLKPKPKIYYPQTLIHTHTSMYTHTHTPLYLHTHTHTNTHTHTHSPNKEVICTILRAAARVKVCKSNAKFTLHNFKSDFPLP